MQRVLDVVESKKILDKYGVPFVKSFFVKNINGALIAANNIGYPIALKLVSKQVVHKTDAGAVVINITNDSELEKSFNRMLSDVKRKIHGMKIDGFLVQKMIDGIQTMVGGKMDETFGQVISFGLGGILVEILEDVTFRVVPINSLDATNMIADTKVKKILSGVRGKKYDAKAVEEILFRVSKMLSENEKILELDINPLIVLEKGAVAVDARIVLGA